MEKNDYQEINKIINKRNYGIDLLRFLCMINIINLHTNYFSGFFHFIKYNQPQYKSIWLLESFSKWSVDGFGLISGIVGYKKYKFSNLIYIWFTVFFYSILISLIIFFINKNVSKKKLILSLFPILIKRHWYVNAYFQMYLLLPFLNEGIRNLSKKKFKIIMLFFISYYSLYNILGIYLGINNNSNFLFSGYSGMWLTILYIIGAYFGKYILVNNNNNKNNNFIIFIILYLFSSVFSSEIRFILFEIKSQIQKNIFIKYFLFFLIWIILNIYKIIIQ